MTATPPHEYLFRKLLDDAEGRSEFVISVILDVRDFSSFAMKVESVQTSAFLIRIYKEMIDRYFKKASFIKPTGDGLLLAFPYNERTLKSVADEVLRSCSLCVTNFSRLCDGDQMINYPVPLKVGIGISRGAATRLLSNDITIDYSGRPFNIASRLMEIARPEGIVLDGSFGHTLLPAELLNSFSVSNVYLKGIAENQLTKIYYSKDLVVIPIDKTAMPETEWSTASAAYTLKYWKNIDKYFEWMLARTPIDTKNIAAEYYYQLPEDKGQDVQSTDQIECSFIYIGDSPRIRINIPLLVKRLAKAGIQDDDIITVVVKYQTKKLKK